MFGLLRPTPDPGTRGLPGSYMSRYCDLCGVLALQYGVTARALIVHDIATLGWLLEPEDGPPVVFPRMNCLKGGTRSVDAEARLPRERERLEAALSCYALAVKVQDDLVDEPSWRGRALRKIFAGTFERANRDLRRLEFPVNGLEATLAEQTEIEKQGVADLDVAAGPTGRAYALVARQLVLLSPDALINGGTGVTVETAETIGDALGRCVYAIDAYRDIESDRGIRYNPLCCSLASTDRQLAGRQGEAQAYVARQLRRAGGALGDASAFRQRRWRTIEHRLRALVGLQPATVTLNATCCIPCGNGAVVADEKECWPVIFCCFCGAACFCQKLCG